MTAWGPGLVRENVTRSGPFVRVRLRLVRAVGEHAGVAPAPAGVNATATTASFMRGLGRQVGLCARCVAPSIRRCARSPERSVWASIRVRLGTSIGLLAWWPIRWLHEPTCAHVNPPSGRWAHVPSLH